MVASIENDPKSISAPEVVKRVRFHQRFPLWTVPVTLFFALLVWEALTRWSGLPEFMLPSPQAVASRLFRALSDGSLLRHTWVTLLEVLGGLALGLSIATCLGYGLAKSNTIERLLAPYIVASQSVPVVAIAPLLVIWFGPGRLSKLLISGLIVFFPVLVNTIVGVRSVPEDLRDLMRSLRATRWQIFTKLEVPAAMPIVFGGLKIGATLSVIGAVVGEFVGADEGLGFLINVGRGLYDTALVYVVVFDLIGMAMTLYGIVAGLERRLLAWREVPSRLPGG
ncbi:MAG TPA: ABC transporter permease [Anaerolineae bacterium]|nr:ABC transporter permease [Anaerolineae bacterium]